MVPLPSFCARPVCQGAAVSPCEPVFLLVTVGWNTRKGAEPACSGWMDGWMSKEGWARVEDTACAPHPRQDRDFFLSSLSQETPPWYLRGDGPLWPSGDFLPLCPGKPPGGERAGRRSMSHGSTPRLEEGGASQLHRTLFIGRNNFSQREVRVF